MEVEATVSNVMGLKDATSYGVEIAGSDGMHEVNSKIKILQLFYIIYFFNPILVRKLICWTKIVILYLGRAGMIAIGADEGLPDADLEKLYSGVKDKLPSYARPYFLRVVTETDMTGMLCI